MLVFVISTTIAVFDNRETSGDSNKHGKLASGTEHRSKEWYEEHRFSDGRKIPLNASNTGIYIEKLYALELAKGSFRSKGYVWSKWNGIVRGWDQKSWPKQDPLDGMYMNTLNNHDSSIKGENYTYTSDHGWKYVYRNFDAEFESHFNFRKYPFDSQVLTLRFFSDGDAAIIRNYIDRDSTIDRLADSFGEYKIEKVSFRDAVYEYPTRFGLTDYDKHEKQQYSVSSIIAEIKLVRSNISGFWKEILPPLLTTMLLLVNTVSPLNGWEDTKAAIPPAVLLSLIFLHQGYQSRLPTLDYLTFMDTFYILLYALTIYMAVEVIVSSSIGSLELKHKVKRISQGVYIMLALVLPVLAWFVM